MREYDKEQLAERQKEIYPPGFLDEVRKEIKELLEADGFESLDEAILWELQNDSKGG